VLNISIIPQKFSIEMEDFSFEFNIFEIKFLTRKTGYVYGRRAIVPAPASA